MLLLAVKSVFYKLLLVINMLYKTRKQLTAELKIVGNKCCFLAFERNLVEIVLNIQRIYGQWKSFAV